MSVLVAVGWATVAVVRVDAVAFAGLGAFGMSGLDKCFGIGVALRSQVAAAQATNKWEDHRFMSRTGCTMPLMTAV